MNYDVAIGLEVHAQLATQTKLWCRCPVTPHGMENDKVCEICSGHPGTLPVLNLQARDFAIQLGLATQCRINLTSFFDRKHYFYPDLPKGYQITQYQTPLCQDGQLTIPLPEGAGVKTVSIQQIQLEEDSGKLSHEDAFSLIDLNRAGTPLVEIVGRPELANAQEAVIYLKQLHAILSYLGVSKGNLQEGNLRCDVNISLAARGAKKLGTRTETKKPQQLSQCGTTH